eukprot:g49679.t1
MGRRPQKVKPMASTEHFTLHAYADSDAKHHVQNQQHSNQNSRENLEKINYFIIIVLGRCSVRRARHTPTSADARGELMCCSRPARCCARCARV